MRKGCVLSFPGPADASSKIEGRGRKFDIGTSLAYTTSTFRFRAFALRMVIIETTVFTRQVQALLADEAYRRLQMALAEHPDLGTLIPQGGGLRKVRWGGSGRGKRGGVRVIYYWARPQQQLLRLFIYAKSERDDLTPIQLKMLRTVIEESYP